MRVWFIVERAPFELGIRVIKNHKVGIGLHRLRLKRVLANFLNDSERKRVWEFFL
jgi:hypothetical protein